mgnify:CR=1 FL=1
MEDVWQQEAGLMHFLTASEEKLHILVVESAGYLPKLRELFPQAIICAVAADEDIRERPAEPAVGGSRLPVRKAAAGRGLL